MTIKIIVGPPAAGKTTWMDANAPADAVKVDFDRLAQALGNTGGHSVTDPWATVTHHAWQAIVDDLLAGDANADIIHTHPDADQVKRYQDAGAGFILIDPGQDVVLKRAADAGRGQDTEDYIRDWYKDPPHLPADLTEVIGDTEAAARDLDDTGTDRQDSAKAMPATPTGPLLTKTIRTAIKAAGDTDTGALTFEGYASVFGNKDLAGDIVMPGAFTRTLDERYPDGGAGIPVYWNHKVDDPFANLGATTRAIEDDHGLKVEGTIDTSTDLGRQVAHLLKEGRVAQMSFQYNVRDGAWVEPTGDDADPKDWGHFEIKDVDLFEVSICPIGCNQATEVSAKDAFAAHAQATGPDPKICQSATPRLGLAERQLQLITL